MNGPEHYREAERLLGGDALDMAAAQVHATLALAAATVQPLVSAYVGETNFDSRLWAEATSPMRGARS